MLRSRNWSSLGFLERNLEQRAWVKFDKFHFGAWKRLDRDYFTTYHLYLNMSDAGSIEEDA